MNIVICEVLTMLTVKALFLSISVRNCVVYFWYALGDRNGESYFKVNQAALFSDLTVNVKCARSAPTQIVFVVSNFTILLSKIFLICARVAPKT